jgi:Spy/CpxP family protein refolding chaperone
MKHFFLAILVSLIVWVSSANFAHAQPPAAATAVEPTQVDTMADLKATVLPQIQAILTPEQQEQLETAIVEGNTSIRKAFKSLTLTPAQKVQLATVFKSLPKKEVLTTMSPAQKREFFMKKKEIFKPTAEEISGYAADPSK